MPLRPWEILLILLVLLLVFGAKRLPEMGRSLGRGMREFKDTLTGDDDKAAAPPPASLPSAPSEPSAQAPSQPAPPEEQDASETAERESVR
jgi:sec-independent protein translocase protein TatA